ncbi:tagaturonate reductase, partial [Bacillus vallismortis]|nr:tagaturonate reductase [Bacillus vallismortis]
GLHTKIVSDQTPYRHKKVRIFKGAQTAKKPEALLYGLKTVRDDVEHPEVWQFIREMISYDILPVLLIEGLSQYANDVL